MVNDKNYYSVELLFALLSGGGGRSKDRPPTLTILNHSVREIQNRVGVGGAQGDDDVAMRGGGAGCQLRAGGRGPLRDQELLLQRGRDQRHRAGGGGVRAQAALGAGQVSWDWSRAGHVTSASKSSIRSKSEGS